MPVYIYNNCACKVSSSVLWSLLYAPKVGMYYWHELCSVGCILYEINCYIIIYGYHQIYCQYIFLFKYNLISVLHFINNVIMVLKWNVYCMSWYRLFCFLLKKFWYVGNIIKNIHIWTDVHYSACGYSKNLFMIHQSPKLVIVRLYTT